MPFSATYMHLEISISDKDKYHIISHMCNLKKMIQMNLFTKQKQTHRHRKQTWLTKGKVKRDKLEPWY